MNKTTYFDTIGTVIEMHKIRAILINIQDRLDSRAAELGLVDDSSYLELAAMVNCAICDIGDSEKYIEDLLD